MGNSLLYSHHNLAKHHSTIYVAKPDSSKLRLSPQVSYASPRKFATPHLTSLLHLTP